jgi:hypothetical protein
MTPFTTTTSIKLGSLRLDVEVSIEAWDEFDINAVFHGDEEIMDLLSPETLDRIADEVAGDVYELIAERRASGD